MGTVLQWTFYDKTPPKELFDQWNKLCELNPHSCASSYPVFAEQSKYLLSDKSLIYAFAYDKTQMVCAIPLFSKSKRLCLIKTNVLQLVNHDHLDFHIIAGQNLWNARDLISSFMIALRQERKDWHYFQARNLFFGNDFNCKYNVPYYEKQTAYFTTAKKESIEQVIPKKLLKNINRHQKKIISHDEMLILKCINTIGDVISALDTFLEIEDSGWKGKSNTSISSQEETYNFYKKLFSEYAKQRKAQIYLLYVNDKAIAGAISFKHDKTIYLHKIAYSADLMSYSPGSIMIKMIIEEIITQSSASSLCLNTNPKWVDRWHPELMHLTAVEDFNDNLKGRILKILFRLHRFMKQVKVQIKQLMKKPC